MSLLEGIAIVLLTVLAMGAALWWAAYRVLHKTFFPRYRDEDDD